MSNGREAPFAAAAAALALLPHLRALRGDLTYYFRDFSVTFYPLRLFAARELREARWPSWNPFFHEGSFQLPVLYPLDLLHVFWPSPEAVSWLLTLHFPLAAVGMYVLARHVGSCRGGAVVAGSVYALSGLAVSSLSLYVFLQSLALAPWCAWALARAAGRGGRSVVLAAAVLAVALTTLAVEFVGQAWLFGVVLGLVLTDEGEGGAGTAADRARRLGLASLLGLGLAALPIALVVGLLGETVRGAGFDATVALGNEVHPAAFLQVLVPNLFGSLAAPVESWWGGAFFTKGFPYFLSLYLGPLTLALAAVGLAATPRRLRLVLLALIVLGCWYSLGAHGGLAPLLARLPLVRSFRFPSKALLLPVASAALLAGLGTKHLKEGRDWGRLAGAAGVIAIPVAVLGLALQAGVPVARLASLDPTRSAMVTQVVAGGCLWAVLQALAAVLVAVAVRRGRVRAALGAAALVLLAIGDLSRAAVGMNPQVPPAFFRLLLELEALHLDRLEGGRVFTYGIDHSPAFRAFLAAPVRGLGLWSFFVNRQLLAPYNNVVDRVEIPEAKDLTSFVPRAPELVDDDYDPARVGLILDRLRNAAVTRLLSLDPLDHPDLKLLAVVAAGPPGLFLRAYEVARPWPRVYLACRVRTLSAADALEAPYLAGFDPRRDVALSESVAAGCREGTASVLAWLPASRRYQTESDGAGLLVSRDSFSRGWSATVDGRPAPVLRANGKHQAVPVPEGRHLVALSYEPPGWSVGLMASGLAVLAALGLAVRPRWPRG